MTDRVKLVVTHRIFDETAALLASHCEMVLNQDVETLPPETVRERARDADAILAFMPDRVDAAFLHACPDLRMIACALKGYDNFDVGACTRRGVWLSIVPDLLTAPTAELAVGLVIALGRHIGTGDRLVRSGAFRGWRPELYGTGICGSTVGIVGMGNLGQAIARRIAAFAPARLLYADPRRYWTDDERGSHDLAPEYATIEGLLALSDIVVLAAPLTEETRNIVDAPRLALAKPGALLVNVGRGSVVDEEAVAAALSAGTIGGYAADVFAFEDRALVERPRQMPAALRGMEDKTLFTPHLGSATFAARRAIERHAAESILDWVDGRPPRGAVNSPVTPAPRAAAW